MYMYFIHTYMYNQKFAQVWIKITWNPEWPKGPYIFIGSWKAKYAFDKSINVPNR